MNHDDAFLVAAAKAEVASRGRHYPALVASGKLGADEATIDFQAWHIIARWLETGGFRSIYAGGADGQVEVGWPHAVAAADRAVVTTEQALKAARGDGEKVARLDARLTVLRLIARLVARERARIDMLNQALRERHDADRQQAA